MDKLLTLLTLQRQAQEAETFAGFLHIAANDSSKIIPYHQLVIYSYDRGIIEYQKISGNAIIDRHGEYAVHLESCIRQRDKTRGEISEHQTADGTSTLTIVPFCHKPFVRKGHEDDAELGGMCFETIFPYQENEKQILEELARSYTPRVVIDRLEHGSLFVRIRAALQRKKIWIAAGILIALFPTRMTITAPVEIVAKDPVVITAPFSGLIGSVDVSPGDHVEPFAPLIHMEDTTLSAEAQLAGEEMKLAAVTLSRLKRESVSNPERRADLARLEAEITEKKIKQAYTEQMKNRSVLRTPKAGVTIFADRTELEGKPVEAGQILMQIADPAQIEARIRIPSATMMPVKRNEPVSLTFDPRPFHSYEGDILSIGYEASPDPDGLLSYKVTTGIRHNETADLRIGWRGAAKIKGEWTIMGYRILRRPLMIARQWTGL